MLSLSVLASVKVASELEALKKTAGHALNALGESRESAAAKAKSATSMLTSGTSASTATSTSMSTGDAVETEDDAAIPTGKLDLFNDIAALLDDMDRKMNISHAEVRTNQTKPNQTKPIHNHSRLLSAVVIATAARSWRETHTAFCARTLDERG